MPVILGDYGLEGRHLDDLMPKRRGTKEGDMDANWLTDSSQAGVYHLRGVRQQIAAAGTAAE